jgi:hypothetical protein
MLISATDQQRAAVVLREAARRLSHHTNNAANAVMVNVEVIRARAGRPGVSAESLVPFAERAAAGVEQATAGLAATQAVLIALASAAASGELHVRSAEGEPEAIELVLAGDHTIDPAAERFAAAAGVVLSRGRHGVILKVLRRGAAVTDVTL